MAVADTSGVISTTVANGETESAAIELGRYTLAGVQIPGTLTSTTMTFQVSVAGSTYVPLYVVADDGTQALATIDVAASRGYSLPFSWFAQWSYVKLVMGSAEGGARSISLAIVAV